MPDRRAVNKSITSSYLETLEAPEPVETDSNIVAIMVELYEKASGKVLTPRDLEILVDFADTYPDGWFREALKEYPGKPLSYLEKVLENRLKEGKSGESRKGNRKLRPRNSYTASGNDDV
ncbi:hypothetical protein LCGC14_1352910 [marine sediment metagenome]|uniref:Uncharacterized protein n=1 Tax=marine sediment metagenome TaxID=412755 RepID=A0A0F9MR08_9ZZZZ